MPDPDAIDQGIDERLGLDERLRSQLLREELPVPKPSLIGEASFDDVIAAVRLGLLMRGLGTPDDCLDVLEELTDPHVPRDPSSTMPTRLLVEAIKLARPRRATRRARPH